MDTNVTLQQVSVPFEGSLWLVDLVVSIDLICSQIVCFCTMEYVIVRYGGTLCLSI